MSEKQADEGASIAVTSGRSQTDLPPEAIQFAHRMFDAARNGDDVLLHAIDAGLPVNLTNDEGEYLPIALQPCHQSS